MFDTLCLSLLLLPFAFFWCCCSGCAFCSAKETVDIEFDGDFGQVVNGWPQCCEDFVATRFTLTYDTDLSTDTECYWTYEVCDITITLLLQEGGLGGYDWAVSLASNGFAMSNGSYHQDTLDCDEADMSGAMGITNPSFPTNCRVIGSPGTFYLNPT